MATIGCSISITACTKKYNPKIWSSTLFCFAACKSSEKEVVFTEASLSICGSFTKIAIAAVTINKVIPATINTGRIPTASSVNPPVKGPTVFPRTKPI